MFVFYFGSLSAIKVSRQRRKSMNPEYFGIGLITLALILGLTEKKLSFGTFRFANLIYVIGIFAIVPYCIWWLWGNNVGPTELTLFVVMFSLTGLGTGVGYHRLETHGSFKTKPSIEAFFLILGAMGLPTGPIDFCVGHYAHHINADKEGDPHSPRDGFWHSHVGHILRATPKDLQGKFGQRLLNDKLVKAIDESKFVWFGLGLLIPYLIAGWPGLLWGGFIRIAYHNHVTFSVNSICHTFGNRPFDTQDDSRNNWLIGVLSFGEGFHNNHHAKAKWAYHGLTWWQIDVNGYVIRLLERLGLAWDVVKPTPEDIQARKKQLKLSPGLTPID
ncbi:MAG: acyl-CoA desaturase [Candidatus Levybacteria bacterium]|nr:acyl-CoA desaturase [Candidatus Levybacteria bacterium]